MLQQVRDCLGPRFEARRGATGFVGGVFDGRYLYLVPYADGRIDGIVARYDTQQPFDAAVAWTTFDTSSVDPRAVGYAGGVFDGRYLYLVPVHTTTSGVVARLDTHSDFTCGAAWQVFDPTTLDAAAEGYFSAAFDGEYVYLVPNANGKLARFHATTTPVVSGTTHGSFF